MARDSASVHRHRRPYIKRRVCSVNSKAERSKIITKTVIRECAGERLKYRITRCRGKITCAGSGRRSEDEDTANAEAAYGVHVIIPIKHKPPPVDRLRQ